MEQLHKRCAVLIFGIWLAMMCLSCAVYNTYYGTWYCKELGITFSFDDDRSYAYTAYGTMRTEEGSEDILCSIGTGGYVQILKESARNTLYENRKEDDMVLRAIAKLQNGKLVMRERIADEYTGKIYVFEQIAPGPTLVTQEELPTAQ